MNTLKPAVFAIATALASAFGPMPDESATIDAAMGKEGIGEDAGAQRKIIHSFLVDSRKYLGL